jgi:hypothetical protein
MGAAATVEMKKPADGSDIREGGLEFARCELSRLRTELGHMAQTYGMSGGLVLDASDMVLGENQQEDLDR